MAVGSPNPESNRASRPRSRQLLTKRHMAVLAFVGAGLLGLTVFGNNLLDFARKWKEATEDQPATQSQSVEGQTITQHPTTSNAQMAPEVEIGSGQSFPVVGGTDDDLGSLDLFKIDGDWKSLVIVRATGGCKFKAINPPPTDLTVTGDKLDGTHGIPEGAIHTAKYKPSTPDQQSVSFKLTIENRKDNGDYDCRFRLARDPSSLE